MPRNVGVSVENNFTKGLITEVTGVNSPENSVVESLDVIYDRRGRAMSRKGFRNEPAAVDVSVATGVNSGPVRNEFLWETVAGLGSKAFLVAQIGSRLHFFEVSSNAPLSSGFKSFSVNLLAYKISSFSDSDVGSNLASFTTGKGYLFVAHPMCDPVFVKYNNSTDTITTTKINIQIRDLEGVNDGLRVDQRPTSLSVAHRYNLLNQGWYARIRRGDNNYGQALDAWDRGRSDFPSNVDNWWYYTGTTTGGGGNPPGLEYLSLAAIDSRTGLYGNTPAPKGHYIINAFQTNRASVSGVSGVQEKSSGGYRPSVVAFFAGRAFYAGVSATDFSSTIYFSQIIERDEQLGQCYQQNDPTSREIFDLLDSDGGTVKIQDLGNVIDLRVVGQALMVFATNGVWSISGSDNGPFKATDFTVTKISSFPAVSRSTIVDVGGLPVWWNYEGIFALSVEQAGLTTSVKNLSETTIQKFYDEIPPTSKMYAKGAFNEQEGVVYWIYKSIDDDDTYRYDRILVLDAVTLAFYPLSIPSGTFKISGITTVRGVTPQTVEDPVTTSSGDPVTTSGGDPVVINEVVGYKAGSKEFKFIKYTGNSLTFAEIMADDYLDFGSSTYSPYFVTGYRIRGELIKRFQTNYLTVITEDISNGSCYIQGVWDYANHPNSGRYTNPQQVYRNRLLRDYQKSRLKMRGNGRSLQFRFFGEGGKPFVIVGWVGWETSETAP